MKYLQRDIKIDVLQKKKVNILQFLKYTYFSLNMYYKCHFIIVNLFFFVKYQFRGKREREKMIRKQVLLCKTERIWKIWKKKIEPISLIS